MKQIKIGFIFLLVGCNVIIDNENIPSSNATTLIALKDKAPLTNGFDFPVGIPNANGYYKALDFGEQSHLGEDWNGVGGGNTDLGDTVYCVANGYVFFAKDVKGGWGNVIRIIHAVDTNSYIESLYAHLDTVFIKPGVSIKKGTSIGTIGTAHGKYLAHLHFELRDSINMPIGGGYDELNIGYLNPTTFIEANR